MKVSLKEAVRQITPPILLDAAKRAFRGPPPKRDRDGLFALRDGLNFRISPECWDGMKSFRYGDQALVAEMDRFLAATRGCRRLLDVGACHGVFALAFCAGNPGRRAVAVEPSPVALAKLLYNINANPSLKIAATETALSDHAGAIGMSYEWEHAVAGGNDLVAAASTGDELCGELEFVPDVIKIDVEGHENAVLAGLATVLAAARPLLFLEVHHDRTRFDRAPLDALGYRIELVSTLGADQRMIAMPGQDMP